MDGRTDRSVGAFVQGQNSIHSEGSLQQWRQPGLRHLPTRICQLPWVTDGAAQHRACMEREQHHVAAQIHSPGFSRKWCLFIHLSVTN